MFLITDDDVFAVPVEELGVDVELYVHGVQTRVGLGKKYFCQDSGKTGKNR